MFYSRPYNQPCLGCFEFNGYHDQQLCSVCYANRHGAPKVPHQPKQWRNAEELDADVERWLATGIHSTHLMDTCRICLTENIEVGSKFSCECSSADVCLTCMPMVNSCPICKDGQYCRISKQHLPLKDAQLRSWDTYFVLGYLTIKLQVDNIHSIT